MPLTTITAGMSVKNPGPTDYSSVGHTLALAVELDVQDAEHARAAVSALFAEVKAALEAEVANGSPSSQGSSDVNIWGGSGGNGGNGNERRPVSRPARTGGNGDRAKSDPISNKQAKYLFQLARRAGMKTQSDVGSWLRENLGVDRGVYELTKIEASRAIDILNNGNGGNGK